MATAAEQLAGTIVPTRVSTAPFSRWSYEDIAAAVKAQLPTNYEERKKYAVDHNHFQNGTQWVGPGSATANDKIEEQFAPDDAVGDALSNIANAFREPQVSFTPIQPVPEGEDVPPDLAELIDEATSLVYGWWDRNRVHEVVQDRLKVSAWNGFACVRLWIPDRFLMPVGNSIEIAPTSDFAEALDMIYLTSAYPAASAIVTHPQTQDKCAIFLSEEKRTVAGQEVTVKRADITYLDSDRERDADADTYIRTVWSDDRLPPKQQILELGGKLLAAEMRTKALLTDPVLRTQRQLNLLCSLITRLGETAAFRERYTTNARPQGLRILYEEGDDLPDGAFIERDEEAREWAVIPVARTLGANTTTELVGLPRYDKDGNPQGHETPGVEIVDPVDPTPYINASESVRRRILRMCAQGHLAGSSNFEVSGIAYEQARAVFEKDLNARRVAEEGMLRELLINVLTFAEYITGRDGYFTNRLQVHVDQLVDAGPRSPDTVRLDHEAYEKGLLSQETVMSRIGVEDPVAEQVRLRNSPERILELISKAGEIGATFSADGVLRMLELLGVPGAIASALKVSDTDDLPSEQ